MILLKRNLLMHHWLMPQVISERSRNEKDAVFLLDNGDNLQGQPAVYYYNFIDTVSPHFMSEVFNWLEYDAVTAGNHDIEAGHSVYDRLVKEYNFPLLAANAVDIKRKTIFSTICNY